jgi:hypothetical protein
MLWTGGTFIQMFYIAHLLHRLVLFAMISFNIFFYSCFSKRIQKDAAVWNHKTRNFRHYEVFSLSASRISLHQKRYMLQRFCSIWCHAYFMQPQTYITYVIYVSDATLYSYLFGWRTTADLFYPGTSVEDRVQLVSSRVKVNGCCPRTH